MAQERPLTPEKQLLNLIEGSKTNAASVKAQAIKRQGLSLFSFSAWLGRFSFTREQIKKWFGNLTFYDLDVRVTNKILGFCIFILFLYFVSNLCLSIINLKKMPNLEFKLSQGANIVSAQGPVDFKKAASFYLEKVKERNIFKLGKDTSAAEGEIKAPSSRIIEVTQQLKLVGISWSDNPDAMIEDTKALRTFFVKKGQMVGGVKVQAIFKDKVVLSYEQEEIELR